ncbi:MAG: extracellular solute-binding protein [Alphaproteobacteria bacterium]|nr:extracellular solute-binding protein [Alphaproteobacteria bacterium]
MSKASSTAAAAVRASRRTVLALIAATAIAAPGFAQNAIPGTNPPLRAGKPFNGVTINVPTQRGWASFAPAVERTKEFEEMTGIKVNYDMIPGSEIPTKQLLAVSQKSGAYDIITQHASSFGSFFRFLTPMDDRIRGVWGSVDKFEDWLFPAQKGVRNKDGKHYFIPFHANAQIGYYRKQLLEDPAEQAAFKAKYGYDLAPPTTIKQVQDIAAFFTRPDRNMYGLTANWGEGQGFGAFLDYYNATGHNQLDDNYNPTMKSGSGRAAAVAILTWMQNALHRDKFVNPDSAKFQTGQVSDYFLSGASALAYGWLSDYWQFMQKPENIKQVGPVGAFRFPSFTDSKAGGASSWWMMGIPQDAKNPEAAWEYIKWLLNEPVQTAMAAGQLPPIKELAVKTAVNPGGINPRALYDAFAEARIVIQVPEMSQQPRTKGIELYTQLIANKLSPEQMVDEYVAEIERTMKRAGYVK